MKVSRKISRKSRRKAKEATGGSGRRLEQCEEAVRQANFQGANPSLVQRDSVALSSCFGRVVAFVHMDVDSALLQRLGEAEAAQPGADDGDIERVAGLGIHFVIS